jgi:antibiotic biosynthesis monooxygenase (ABM) superfamily enzyme
MHGAAPASRVVILQFDSVDKAQAWANAAATKALFATGEKYATLSDYAGVSSWHQTDSRAPPVKFC